MPLKVKQWFSVVRAKKPARIVLYAIGLLNLAILLAATFIFIIIHRVNGNETGFFKQMYHTMLVMINAGSITDIVDETTKWNPHMVFSAIFYLLLVFVTMISFTGALIGYLTNKISQFVEQSNAGAHRLLLSEHTVILNWNSHAAEIINDMLYKQKRERIVVLVQNGKETIETEIADRLNDTVRQERLRFRHSSRSNHSLRQWICARRAGSFHNLLTIIVREGDIFSAERLADISVGQAKSIILLSREHSQPSTDSTNSASQKQHLHGDCGIVKLLMQVAEIAGNEASRDQQQIVVEVNSSWTMNLVNQVICQKQKAGKSNIIPVPVDHILGDILAQIIITPELNLVYSELFSYRGAEFFTRAAKETNENQFVSHYLPSHHHALPLTVMENNGVHTSYFIAMCNEDINRSENASSTPYTVQLNPDYQIENKGVIILGHNEKSLALLEGLYAFDVEWQGKRKLPVLDIIVIDDEEALAQNNYYQDFPHLVRECISADIHDQDTICTAINNFIDSTTTQISILILSDDTSDCDDADRSAFTHLIYLQSVISMKQQKDPTFNSNRVDVVVELCNPKNADIIANYNVNYVIISNRYISRLLNHLSEKEALYYFLTDILTYDDIDGQDAGTKEIYLKRVGDFFAEPPAPATAAQLVRAVHETSPLENKALVIGYVTADKQLTLFAGDQHSYNVHLQGDDYLVVFSNH